MAVRWAVHAQDLPNDVAEVRRPAFQSSAEWAGWTSGLIYLFRGGECERLVVIAEQPVDPREQQRACANDETRGDGAPEHVGLREFPNRENRGDHSDDNAQSDDPERDSVYGVWIEKPALRM